MVLAIQVCVQDAVESLSFFKYNCVIRINAYKLYLSYTTICTCTDFLICPVDALQKFQQGAFAIFVQVSSCFSLFTMPPSDYVFYGLCSFLLVMLWVYMLLAL